jgi:L-aspartate oxidase
MTHQHFDVLILGSGAAGLSLALQLNPKTKIALICKNALAEGSTLYAQGGVAAVMAEDDTLESHIQDTIVAGGGLCERDVIEFTVKHAKECIQWLVDSGVEFTPNTDPTSSIPFHLAQEGGHSHRRILHAADATGRAVSQMLTGKARQQKNISLFEHHMAVDLIVRDNRCCGAYIFNCKTNQVQTFSARCVVLATGGASKVYLYTTNPDVSSGDGIAMAWRAGCRVANMEFNQFHPTCLYHPNARTFLLTEAIRGEGGKLRLPNGSTFMERFDPRLELAPRDIVARAIDHEMKRLGIPCVYLDISHKPADFIIEHFPTIYEHCMKLGLNMTKEPLPVVPAAHYTCGGVMTNLQGQTDIANLYAAGEVAYTGLHGANRMASNSLLECLVFAASAAKNINRTLDSISAPPTLPHWDESKVSNSDEAVVVAHNWDELRRFMWNYVGIVRTNNRLERAQHRIQMLKKEIHDYYGSFRLTADLIELRNLAVVADLIIRSALARKESRGLHYNLDCLESSDNFLQPTVLTHS